MEKVPQTRVAMWSDRDGPWFEAASRAVFRVGSDGRSSWLDPATGDVLPAPVEFVHEPLADLDGVLAWGSAQGQPGGWVGLLSYDLGRVIEPAVEGQALARPHAARDREWPLIELHRVSDRRPWTGAPGVMELGPMRGENGERYRANVSSALAYIRSGHIFQANLAHRMTGAFSGDPLGAFSRLVTFARPRHGVYLRLVPEAGLERAVASASPEMFFRLDPDGPARRITARPMKGTRPAAVNPRELMDSAKDRAELDMIIDLMRNDIGRISTLRTVRVDSRRDIELHGENAAARLWQATATVSGLVREGVTLGGIIGAVFPAGSVTGAPKIRAMQVIDELEQSRRGPYCGSLGWIGDDGSALMNVAIRTALISGASDGRGGIEGPLDYSVGAGIVADSDPEAEWEETIAKAGVLRALGTSGEAKAIARSGNSSKHKAQSTHS